MYQKYYGDGFNHSTLDAAKDLIGKKLLSITDNVLIFEDCTKVQLHSTSGCCAWYEGTFICREENFTDYVVTDVEQESTDDESEDEYVIHFLSAHKTLFDMEVVGDPTTGYYVHDVELTISFPETRP